MADGKLTISRTTDARVLDALEEIANAYQASLFRINVFGLREQVDPRSSGKGLVKTLRKKNLTSIESADVHLDGFIVRYFRGARNGDARSGVFDELTFQTNTNVNPGLDSEKRLEIVSALSSRLGSVNQDLSIGGAQREAQSELEALHNSILVRLEQTATTQLQKNSDYLRELEADHAKRRKELEASFDQRQAELDNRLEDNRRELETRTKQLDGRERELDNRTHTHARRAIRGDLKQELQRRDQEFRLTKGTRQMRWPLHVLCAALLVGLGCLLGYTSWETLNLMKVWSAESKPSYLQPEFYYVILRQVVLAMAFGGTAIFYARWLNNWQQEHATAEFELKRFQLDVDRASWVVETAFEWQSQIKEAMPPELLAAMTHRLFDARSSTDDDVSVHPADELASALMGTASKVTLHAGPAEVEIDGRRLRRSKPIQGELARAPNGHAA